MSLTRRTFLGLSTVAPLIAGTACRPATIEDRLTAVLGLGPDQSSWLDGLSAEDRQYLLDSLTAPDGTADARARRILFQLFGRRDRLFAFAADVSVAARRGACDGLLRE